LQKINDENVDLVIQGYNFINGNKITEIVYSEKLVSANDYKILFEEQKLVNASFPFSKLFKKSIIDNNKLRFDEKLSYAEDLVFLLNYLPHCEKVFFDDKANYNYYNREASLSKTKRIDQYIRRYQTIKNILKSSYNVVYNSLFNDAYVTVSHSLEERLYSILPLLYKTQKFKKRKEFLENMDKEDLFFLDKYSNHLHPIFKFVFNQITKKNYRMADTLLKLIFTIK